jgi:O-acetyl-ADP-ribose deacetylase (regulator of RNase III)
MIEIKKGNILKQEADALVNTVNCVGVMGRGVALEFKKAFPENCKLYKDACKKGEVKPGSMFVFETNTLVGPKFIINFPTKRHWKEKSRIGDISSGLVDLVKVLKERQICSVAIPPLGCGLGGLDWNVVKPMIEKSLVGLPDVHVVLFEPGQVPPSTFQRPQTEKPKLTVGRAALLALIGKYLEALMDESVSLLEIHKLLYFIQEAGEPLKLKYQKAIYGPYAENLRHVLILLNGHYISGYDDQVDSPEKPIEVINGSISEGEEFLRNYAETLDCFNRVCKLINGFESPFGMELLSTVHWVAMHEGATDKSQAADLIYKWNRRKQMFAEEHIGLAWETLQSQGWINSKAKEHAL